jgi:hypothetical protein
MTIRKARLTVTVDRELVKAGTKAVAAGRVDSLSGWVNLALAERAAKERRLTALARALAVYEAEFGAISPEEMVAQEREDRRSAVLTGASSRRLHSGDGRRRGKHPRGARTS